ncbi:bifunctional DNA primase/polymerase [Gordonia sputi]|uniref:bifunctional DNA primase/polymerase n=1 Tax=Gordonia sputi TaxID=36823 RepID=UPI0022713B86|nr:bifunctional DNA primase/polymerase [Gordonia sputi]
MNDPENDAAPGRGTEGRSTNNNASECVTIHCSDDLAFARRLAALGIPIFVAPPSGGSGEFRRPDGWQRLTADGNAERLAQWQPGWAVCALTGDRLTVLDVDPRNGGDVEHVRGFLDAHGVRVFAEIATPSGGVHFYCAGDPRLHKAAVPELPGVDVQSRGCNVFLPGTVRSHGGYAVGDDADLDALPEGDADGVDVLLDLVGRASAPIDTTGVTDVEIAALLTAGSPDADVSERLEQAIADLASARAQGRSRHKTALSAVGGLLRFGEYADGVAGAVAKLESAFVSLVADRATPADARAEFRSCVRFMASVIAADPTRCVVDLDNFDDVAAFVAGTTLTRERLVEVLAAPLPVDPEVEFWTERPELTTVHDFALSRLVSPWSALGVVLARALSFVPPTVTLPALVGGRGSLNFFALLAGESSAGKSAAFDVGDELLVPEPGYVPARRVNLGTGEGISAAFVRRGKAVEGVRQVVQFAESVTFEVDEIGKVAANVGRGSNLLDELCSAYFGKRLGQQTRDIERNLPLDAHAYRLTVVAGVLRRKAGVIVNDSDRGTPQRFVWLPTTWSALPERLPDEPEPIVLRRNLWTDRPTTIEVPDEVARTIRQTRRERLVTGTATLDGHELFTREKVAYALAVLAGRGDHFTLDDWRLAGVVMGVSRRVRDDLRRAVAEADAAAAAGRGRAQAIASDAATEHGADLHAQRVERVRARVVELLADGTLRTRRQLAVALSGASMRAVLDEALTAGVDDGSVSESGVSRTGTALYSWTGVR